MLFSLGKDKNLSNDPRVRVYICVCVCVCDMEAITV